jgi:nicotinamidase-related amidase
MTQTTNTSPAPRRALIVVDVQNAYTDGTLPIEYPPVQDSLVRIGQAMDAARAAGIPIVVVQEDGFGIGTESWKIHDVVASRATDHLIHKTVPSAFTNTGLAAWLAERSIDTLTVVGYMTHNCNASTLFEARHLGLNAEYLSDASGSVPYANAAGRASAEEIHRVFSVVFESNFAAVVRTEAWIAAVQAGKTLARDNVMASNARARAV